MSDGVAIQVQRLREVAGWAMGFVAQHGHSQQMPVEREIEHHHGRLWQLIEPRAQPPGQCLGGAGRTRHAAQQGNHGFDHECAATLAVVVGALRVKLPTILSHQCQADEFGPGEVRELSVEENEHLGSTLNPAAVQHPDKVHPSGIESVKGQRADFLGHGKKQLQARKFEFLSDAGRGGVLHGCPKDNYIVI